MHDPSPLIRERVTAEDYPVLVEIWLSAVLATHHFLSAHDLRAIESQLASAYLPQVEVVIIEVEGVPVGFAGTVGEKLEMLFIHASHHGVGLGTRLVEHAIRRRGVNAVDVNEQNTGALSFYTARGFLVTGRSAVDDAGRPYPLLHMQRSTAVGDLG